MPQPASITVTSGGPVNLDLLLDSSLPEGNECRCTLYLLGGPLAVVVSSQTKPLAAVVDGKNGYRAPVTLDLPATRPGARFLFRVESLSKESPGASRLLGEVALNVVELSAAEEIRALLSDRSVQLAGKSPKLRELFATLKIPVSDRPEDGPSSISFTEGPDYRWDDFNASPRTYVRFSSSLGSTLTLVAQKSRTSWSVEIRLPRSHDLAGADGPTDLSEALHFILKLESSP